MLVGVVLTVAGPSHPPTANARAPLGGRRLALTVAAALVFALCFTPAPVDPVERRGRITGANSPH